MAVSTRRMNRRLQQNLPVVGGGAVGLGTTVGLRQFVDVQDGTDVAIVGQPGSLMHRLTRPSSAYGLGVGGLSGLLWVMGVGPDWLQDLYLGHAATAIPAGAASAAVPRTAAGGGSGDTATPQRAIRDTGRSNGQQSVGEFAPADGRSAMTDRAN